MAHWKFREERSFGSISCRGKQMQSAGWFKTTHLSFRKVNEEDKTNPSFRHALMFWHSLWNSLVMLTNHVRQLLHMSKEGVWTFCDCCGHSSWLGIHKLPDPVKDFKTRMHYSGAAFKDALSIRLYTLNNTCTSNDDTAFDPTNCTISTKQFDPYAPRAGFFN